MPARRIALCITDLDQGGAEKALTELAVRVDRGRFEPVVYALGPRPNDPNRSCVPRLEEAGVEVCCLGARGVLDAPSVLFALRRRLERQQPALLQSFLFHANCLGRIAAGLAKVPRVVAGIRVAERRRVGHLWLDRLTHRRVDRYVCVSQAVARFCHRQGHLPAEKLVVIPNGIDVSPTLSAGSPVDLSHLGIDPGDPVVLFVGRLDRQKGLRWLLRSAPDWLVPAVRSHLVLVGEGPERPHLEAMLAQSSVADRIHLLGWRSDVPALLAASRVLVLPSQWEGMPNVVLEAMAAGRPVVATEAEGVDELLGPLSEGQTVGFEDGEKLSQHISLFLNNPEQATRQGLRNRQRARETFSIERTVRAYENLWTELLSLM